MQTAFACWIQTGTFSPETPVQKAEKIQENFLKFRKSLYIFGDTVYSSVNKFWELYLPQIGGFLKEPIINESLSTLS